MLAQGSDLCECDWLYIAAVLTHAAEQYITRGAEGSGGPPGVLAARFALPPLKNPLQWIIHYPPGGVELGYEAICAVRWALDEMLARAMMRRNSNPLAHPVFLERCIMMAEPTAALLVCSWGGNAWIRNEPF